MNWCMRHTGNNLEIVEKTLIKLTLNLQGLTNFSELMIGPVAVGVRSSLPFDGIHLLLGNDLAGAKSGGKSTGM